MTRVSRPASCSGLRGITVTIFVQFGLARMPRWRRARRAERDVDTLERRRLDLPDRDGLAAVRHGLTDRALGGECPELPHGELPLLEDPERHLPGGAGGADHRDRKAGGHQYSRST